MADQSLYQIIGVPVTASIAEIEAAAVKRYSDTRNLVNHYSPDIANKANQDLLLIERARTILLNPEKKAEYDRQLGMAGAIGGLADPNQVRGNFGNFGTFGDPSVLGMPKPVQVQQPINQQAPAMDQLVALNAWVCGKCHTPNQKGTKFCKSCGTAVGINCPNCGKLIEASAERCTECGVSLKEVIKQREMEIEMNAKRTQEQMRVQPILSQMKKKADSAMTFSSFWWIILAYFGPIFWIVSLVQAANVLNMADIDSPYAAEYKAKAQIARSHAKRNLIVVGVFVVLALIIAAFNN